MGVGFYGRSFTLADPSCNHAGCAFSAGGNPGPCSASAGWFVLPRHEKKLTRSRNPDVL